MLVVEGDRSFYLFAGSVREEKGETKRYPSYALQWAMMRHARDAGFLRGIPDKATVKSMLQLSVPNGVQQMFFAAGLTALFWIVGMMNAVNSLARSFDEPTRGAQTTGR
mgnify:CR=1 FL=1